VPIAQMDAIRSAWPGKPLHIDWLHAERWIGRAFAEGATTFEALLGNVQAFRAQQDALGRTGSRFIPSPRKWFDGNPGPWSGPFEIPASPTEPKRESAADRMERMLAERERPVVDTPTEDTPSGRALRVIV
jgi:hypothetical protein